MEMGYAGDVERGAGVLSQCTVGKLHRPGSAAVALGDTELRGQVLEMGSGPGANGRALLERHGTFELTARDLDPLTVPLQRDTAVASATSPIAPPTGTRFGVTPARYRPPALQGGLRSRRPAVGESCSSRRSRPGPGRRRAWPAGQAETGCP